MLSDFRQSHAHADRYQEYLNPSVTVEWNNQQKQTRTVTATSEPYWNEQCWFRTDIDKDNGTPLPTELFKTSLSVQCWDNESFSRSPLGYAEIDFLTVFRERKIAVRLTTPAVARCAGSDY